jgi:hypothetical protein
MSEAITPAWVQDLPVRVHSAAREVLTERDAAIAGGAERCRSCRLALRRADRKLDLVTRLKGHDVEALLVRLLRRYGKLTEHAHQPVSYPG